MQYGFQKYLSSVFPSQIIVDLTQFCNLSCIHCPHPIFAKSSHFSGANLDDNIHRKLIDEVATDGFGICQYIRYTANGETLLHPQFEEIIKYAGKYSKTKLNVTTNGHFLDEKHIDILLNAGVDVIDISLDAFTPETYAKIRINGDLEKVKKNVLSLLFQIKNKGSQTKVIMSFVEQPLNFQEAEQFQTFWENAGADFVVIRKLHSSAGYKKNISKRMLDYTKQSERKPCLYPWERITLSPDGKLAFCPADWEHGSHFADFKLMTIKEAWQSDYMIELRKAHMSNEFHKFPFCAKCPDWVNTKWPEEGVSYHNVMAMLVPADLIDVE